MADTQRSLSALLALLADNETGDISEQDARDVLVSLAMDFGELYITSPAPTVLADTTTWVPVGGTWTLSAGAKNFDTVVNGQLRLTDPANRAVVVFGGVSMTCAASNRDVEFGWAKNGTMITSSIQRRRVGTGSDVGALFLVGVTNLNLNDYLDLRVRNITGADNVTAELSNMAAFGVLI